MNIFNFFKKNQKNLKNVYGSDDWKNFISEIREEVFENEEEINLSAIQIISYSNKKINLEKAKMIYVKTRVRMFLSMQEDINEMFQPEFKETVKLSIKVDTDNILSDNETDDIYKFCIYKMPPELVPENLTADKMINFVSGKSYDDGCNADEIPWGEGEFGYNLKNPIPVAGIISVKIYLNRLRDYNGEQITWERTGSFLTDNIKHPIDGYKIFDKLGVLKCLIYISSYHKKISDKAPSGYILTK